jgi:hypothetical protein
MNQWPLWQDAVVATLTMRVAAFGVGPGPVLTLGTPIALWEFSLGVYLIVKGFKPSPITSDMETAKPDRRIPGAAAGGVA